MSTYAQAYYWANRERELTRAAAWREANPELLREIQRACDARPERKARKAEQEKLPERKATRLAYRQANPRTDYHQEYERSYRERRRELHAAKQLNDPCYRLRKTLRANLGASIRTNRKTGSAIKLLGCSIEALRKHLEAQFLRGMSWQNFGRLNSDKHHWQVDHVIPLSAFDLTDKKQLAKACHYTNLAPLWAIDNRRKGNKTIGKRKGVPNGR